MRHTKKSLSFETQQLNIPKAVYLSVLQQFPKSIIRPIRPGASGAGVYELIEENGLSDKILKVVEVEDEQDSLQTEIRLYSFLKGKTPVPEVYYDACLQQEAKKYEWVVLSRLRGSDLKSRIGHVKLDAKYIAYQFGAFLKGLHQIPVSGCPVHVSLDEKLRRAKWQIDRGHVDEADFEADFEGLSVNVLYERLLKERPAVEEFVLTHGDYCLDNVIGHFTEVDVTLSGFIDLSMGGIQDRYQDLALGYRSVRKKLGLAYTEDFIKGYGLLETLNLNKIQYYIMMDELF